MIDDTTLARETCALLGLVFLNTRVDGVLVHRNGGRPYEVSWPDLSQAALKHVEARGWTHDSTDYALLDDDVPGQVTTLTHPEREAVESEWPGSGSEAMPRALCAACVQTMDPA